MHDPQTVAFELRIPLRRSRAGFRNYLYLLTIWHVDPERDGSDDSCGWSFARLDSGERAAAAELITDPHDNVRSWFAAARDEDEAIYQLSRLFRIFKTHQRPWWRHPRWHVWHWKVQVHHVQKFKRWAFSRCAGCGGRFEWGESPICIGGWGSAGPRWLRGEENAYHTGCARFGAPAPESAHH